MTFISVATTHDTEWNKDAAVRAVQTAQVTRLVSRLLEDLSHLDAERQPRLDYLDAEALDAVRGDPDGFHLVGTVAGAVDGTDSHCVSTAYWPEAEGDPVDVELDISDDGVAWGPLLCPIIGSKINHHLRATLDFRQGRIERLELT